MFVFLEKFDINSKKQIFIAGDFNLFFNSKLDTYGWESYYKKEVFR